MGLRISDYGLRSLLRNLSSVIAVLLIASAAEAQKPDTTPPPRGWELFGLPALNFDSDEGFGYGVLAEIYNYGDGIRPYVFTVRPIVFLTTKGRRDVVLFFDAPKLLPREWRLDAQVSREQQLATPYYGVGNETRFIEAFENPPNVYYYRYGRTAFRLLANLQHKLGSLPARGLIGAGFAKVTTDPIPFDSGTTLFRQDFGAAGPRGGISYLRAGLVWDTRDREIAPRSGTYGDLLVQHADRAFGATNTYSRITGILRKYWPVSARLVFAQRLVAQQTFGDMPIYDIESVQTSFRQQEGLGGSNSIRGLPKNRFVGKAITFLNTDLRWRFYEFKLLGKPAHLTASGFFDIGRVWGRLAFEEFQTVGGPRTESASLTQHLHTGYGTGMRIGLGPSFVVATDLARSPDGKGTQIYIGLGYPF